MSLKVNNYLNEVVIYPNAFKKQQCEMIYQSQYLREKEHSISQDTYAFAKRFILKENEKTYFIRQKILRYIEMANQDYYNFDLSYLDNIQLLEYTKDCFFDWHIDIAGRNNINSTRKINALIFLSNPDDYEGGQIEFNLSSFLKKPDINQEQGTLVLFPSHLPHRVTPVTGGIRYTLSAIMNGNTFR